eukprot:1151572-Pelagomonas_calceolata.AAC.7
MTQDANFSRETADPSSCTCVVLVWAVELLALPKLQQIAADGHLLNIVLVQKATLVAFHAHAPQPVGAYRLQHTAQHSTACVAALVQLFRWQAWIVRAYVMWCALHFLMPAAYDDVTGCWPIISWGGTRHQDKLFWLPITRQCLPFRVKAGFAFNDTAVDTERGSGCNYVENFFSHQKGD